MNLSPPPSLLSYRKKKQGKGKKKGSDDSDSDDVEVIKEWNTSSRGRNGEGRNRRASVEERKFKKKKIYPSVTASQPVSRGLELHGCYVGCEARCPADDFITFIF